MTIFPTHKVGDVPHILLLSFLLKASCLVWFKSFVFHAISFLYEICIVGQAHDLQLLVGEIAHLGCVLPPKFVAAGVIAKLPVSWRDFATSLKHKREEISVEYLIAALDVEEKARAKDAPSTSGQNNANFIEKKTVAKKYKSNKPNKTTSFKKKTEKKDMKNITCFVCGKNGHKIGRASCRERV